jgi:hypothetical protein
MRWMPIGTVVIAALGITSAASASWRLDPTALPGNVGIHRCTPRWAQQETGGRALCNGQRIIFRTPTIDPIEAVEITGFRQSADRRHGLLDYRIHLDWNTDSNTGYTTDRIRFKTRDGGRRWIPVTLRRQDINQTTPLGGLGARPATDERLAVKPCVWRSYARPYPHHPSTAAFGNTCIPSTTALRFSL